MPSHKQMTWEERARDLDKLNKRLSAELLEARTRAMSAHKQVDLLASVIQDLTDTAQRLETRIKALEKRTPSSILSRVLFRY